MALNEGGLDAHVAQGPLTFDQVRSLVRQVLTALSRLHRDNKIHGAIRPANLLLDAEGNVKLADSAGVVPRKGMPATGPAKYLAPELLKAEFGPVGPGVDLYCLGFTALELLKGPAFDGLFAGVGPQDIDVEIAWMRWHSSPVDALRPASKLVPGLPADLSTVLDRLLKKNVQERYASASAALHDLEESPAALVPGAWRKKGESSTFGEENPTSLPQADWRPAARNTMPSPGAGGPRTLGNKAVLLLAVLLLSGLVGVACFFWTGPPEKIAVKIASVPPLAKVFVDNEPLGKATDTTYELPPGEYTLRLELENYEPFEGKIGISERKKFHKFTLNKVPIVASSKRTAHIASIPKGASVYINEALQTRRTDGDFVVPDGPFTLKLASTGYKSLERRISSPEQLNETLALERIRRFITVVTDPKGADVYLNDQLQAKQTNGSFEIDDGPLVLKLVHKGLKPEIRTIDDTSQLDKAIEVVFDRAVTLRTNPPGATLFLDGKEREKKSPEVLTLKPGKYLIKATKPGYAPEEKTLVVGVESKLFQEDSVTLRPLSAERHALLIGVREGTKDLPSFVHAEADTELLARTLQVGGFKADKMAVLTQTRGLSKPDELPTAGNIKQRLQGIAANGLAADILVVALIGHVVEAPGGAYFCPAEANLPVPDTLVPLADVLDALASAPAQKKLLILDCWRKDWKNADKLAHVRAWDKTPPPGVTILYACAKGQTGYEHPTRWHGAFNYYLIQGLLGDAAQPQVNETLLANYCKEKVSKLVGETFRDADQIPELASGQRREGWAVTIPRRPAADYLLGCSHLDQKAYDKAVEAFNRAERDLPEFVELYLRRAEAYYETKNYKNAMADCEKALALDSNNADACASLAESQAATKDFISAPKSGARAVDLDPQCALAFDTLGWVYSSSQDYDSALKYITKAIHLQPELFIYYHHRARVERSNKQWDKVIADLSEAIKRNDQKAILFADRGYAWRQKKNSKLAIEDYSEAINLDGTVFSWWLSRLVVRRDSGGLDNAIVDLEKATKLKGDNPNAWITLGVAYREKQLYDKAVEALNQALRLDRNDANAKRLLKEILERK